MADWTGTKIRPAYLDKLKEIATQNKRSAANMLEILIDEAYTKLPKKP